MSATRIFCFLETRPVGAEVFVRSDRQTDMTKPPASLCNLRTHPQTTVKLKTYKGMKWKGSAIEHEVSAPDRHSTVSTFAQSEASTRDVLPQSSATLPLGAP